MKTAIKSITVVAAAAALVTMPMPARAAYFGCTVTKTQQTFTRPNGDRGSRWGVVKKGDELRIEDRYNDWLFVDTNAEGTPTAWIPSSACKAEEVEDYIAFRRRNPDNCGNEGRC